MKEKQENQHRLYHNGKGEVVPSVTTVIKLLDKPELVSWANYMGFKRVNVKELLAEKADYGTRVHSLFEQYMTGIISSQTKFNLEFNQSEFDALIEKMDFINDLLCSKGYEVVNMELPLEGERYGGTLDLLVRHKSTGKYMILDLKTSKDVYRSMFIQLGGYAQLYKECHNIDISHVGIILISQPINGRKLTNVVSCEANKNNEEIFNKLLDIYYLLAV